MYVYEEKTSNLYVHHDVMLSAFPICIEWLGVQPHSFGQQECEKGNFAIVGSFLPDIEIWDLDVMDAVSPSFILAGVDPDAPVGKKKKNKKAQSSASQNQGHSGAVISLSLNKVRK